MQILDEKTITAEMVKVWIDEKVKEICRASSDLNPNARMKTHLMQLVIHNMMTRRSMVEYYRDELIAANSKTP